MANSLVIAGASVIDGVADEPLDNATIVVRDGLIEFLGPHQQAPAPPDDAERIDARGLTILPGLIDAHAHLCLSSGPFHDLLRENLASVAFKAGSNAAVTLLHGITTVRDVGGYQKRLDRARPGD